MPNEVKLKLLTSTAPSIPSALPQGPPVHPPASTLPLPAVRGTSVATTPTHQPRLWYKSRGTNILTIHSVVVRSPIREGKQCVVQSKMHKTKQIAMAWYKTMSAVVQAISRAVVQINMAPWYNKLTVVQTPWYKTRPLCPWYKA